MADDRLTSRISGNLRRVSDERLVSSVSRNAASVDMALKKEKKTTNGWMEENRCVCVCRV